MTAFGPLPLTDITNTPYDLTRLEVPAARCQRCAPVHAEAPEINYDFLGLTAEGEAVMGHLIRRRRAPLLTVSGVKHLLHEMNVNRVRERQQWYAERTAPAAAASPSCNTMSSAGGGGVVADTTAPTLSSSSSCSLTAHAHVHAPAVSTTSFAASASHVPPPPRAQLHRPGCADEDAELICPSCNTALFPVRCMNVLDPLRWSSNMVRGVCRHHLQRIRRAFQEGLRMMQQSAQELAAVDDGGTGGHSSPCPVRCSESGRVVRARATRRAAAAAVFTVAVTLTVRMQR